MAAEQRCGERAFGFTRAESAHRPGHVGGEVAAVVPEGQRQLGPAGRDLGDPHVGVEGCRPDQHAGVEHVVGVQHALHLLEDGEGGGGESPYQGLLAIDVPVMIVHTDEDEVFPGDAVRETASIIRSDGTPVEVVEINGTRGHLDGIVNIALAGEQIRGFLDREID